jgi:micrococcal nuclease
VAAWALALTAGCGPAAPATGDPTIAVVHSVDDGDTLTVDLAGGRERVRLLGIDAPESVDPNRPVQCYGPEASLALAGLVPPGTEVRLVLDVEARDRYDRLLAYAYRAGDDLFVNRWLVTEGYAATSVYPPNVAHAAELAADEAQARAAGRGLWGHCGGPDRPLE